MNGIQILEKEKNLFAEILALSERQLLLFTSEDKNEDEIIQNYQSLIDQRQTLMDAIDSLSGQTKTLDKIIRDKANNSIVQEIQAIIAAISENDKAVLSAGNRILKGFGEQIKQAQTTKQAYNAYNYEDEVSRMGWFIDRKK